MRAALALFLVALGLVLLPRPASALACTASITPVDFGHVDFLSGADVTTTATVTIDCTAIPLTGVRVCPYIGTGSGGEDSQTRYLAGPPSLAFQLFTDTMTVWGDPELGYPAAPGVTFAGNLLATATGHAVLTMNAVIPGGQHPPMGTYQSNFTAADVEFRYGTLSVLACAAIPLLNQTTSPTFTSKVIVDNNCTVGVPNINFGSHGVLTGPVYGSTTMTVRCTSGLPYTIALDNGQQGTGPANRNMKLGTGTIGYGLYRDGDYILPWGDTAGSTTVGGTGTAADQTLWVYGRVPASPTIPAAGTYTDRITVTITY